MYPSVHERRRRDDQGARGGGGRRGPEVQRDGAERRQRLAEAHVVREDAAARERRRLEHRRVRRRVVEGAVRAPFPEEGSAPAPTPLLRGGRVADGPLRLHAAHPGQRLALVRVQRRAAAEERRVFAVRQRLPPECALRVEELLDLLLARAAAGEHLLDLAAPQHGRVQRRRRRQPGPAQRGHALLVRLLQAEEARRQLAQLRCVGAAAREVAAHTGEGAAVRDGLAEQRVDARLEALAPVEGELQLDLVHVQRPRRDRALHAQAAARRGRVHERGEQLRKHRGDVAHRRAGHVSHLDGVPVVRVVGLPHQRHVLALGDDAVVVLHAHDDGVRDAEEDLGRRRLAVVRQRRKGRRGDDALRPGRRLPPLLLPRPAALALPAAPPGHAPVLPRRAGRFPLDPGGRLRAPSNFRRAAIELRTGRDPDGGRPRRRGGVRACRKHEGAGGGTVATGHGGTGLPWCAVAGKAGSGSSLWVGLSRAEEREHTEGTDGG